MTDPKKLVIVRPPALIMTYAPGLFPHKKLKLNFENINFPFYSPAIIQLSKILIILMNFECFGSVAYVVLLFVSSVGVCIPCGHVFDNCEILGRYESKLYSKLVSLTLGAGFTILRDRDSKHYNKGYNYIITYQ